MKRPALVYKFRRFDGSSTSLSNVTPQVIGHWSLNKFAVPFNLGQLGMQAAGVVNGNNNNGVPWDEIATVGVRLWFVVGGGPLDSMGLATSSVILRNTVFSTPRLTVNGSALFAAGRTVEFVKLVADLPTVSVTPPRIDPLSVMVSGDIIEDLPPIEEDPPPPAASEVGIDFDVLDDLRASFALTSGLPNLGNAIARRLGTPAGKLAEIGDDSDYGYDLRDMLGADLTTTELGSLAADVQREVEKDERVEACEVRSVFTWQDYKLALELLVTTAAGPYRLFLGVGEATVDVITGPR